MTQKELLAKCTERDQAFSDWFGHKLDIKAFTDLIDPNQVPYTALIDYHLVINRHKEVIHTFTLEARYMEDAYNFFKYLRDEVIEPDTISDYHILQVTNSDFYQLTIIIA